MGDNLEGLLGPDTCRLCLKSGRAPTPVSNENLEGSLMAIKIDILTSVKVAPSDKVCPMCRINVKNFYDFRIMCVQSDARIKGFAAKVAKMAEQESLSVIKTDQVVRSYKRVRRTTGEVDKQTVDPVKPSNEPLQGNIDLFKSTADLFKSKAQSGNTTGSLFKLKTTTVLMRANDAFKGVKRPIILTRNPTKSSQPDGDLPKPKKNPRTEPEDPLKTNEDSTSRDGDEDPLSSSEDPLMATEDPPSSPEDPLSPVRDPVSTSKTISSATGPLSSAAKSLSSATDPLSSATDPLSSTTNFLSTVTDSLSSDEETNNITVEPLSPAQKDDDNSEDDKESRSNRVIVKIENTLEDESISDSQSIQNDNVESKGKCNTTKADANNEQVKSPSCEASTLLVIKEELPDYEPAEDSENESRNEMPMEDLELKPEEVIIPELKREPDEPELFMEAEYDDMDEYPEESASCSGQPVAVTKKDPKRQGHDSESLEVLVDPLMLMDEDHDAQMESKLSRLSPVLGNGVSIKNGKLPLPQLNGARTDKQRGLDFVKKLLQHKDKSGVDQPAAGESTEKPYRCVQCGWSSAYYKCYMKHRDRHFVIPQSFTCNLCPSAFPTQKDLLLHMKKHSEKAYSCDKCYRSFPSKDRLQAHYSLHTGNKAYVCDLCKKTFAYKSSFVFHMKNQHGEVISEGTFLRCPKCPTEWNTPNELKQHMDVHEKEDPEATSFSCPICSMSFPSKSILNVHARIHQKSKSTQDGRQDSICASLSIQDCKCETVPLSQH